MVLSQRTIKTTKRPFIRSFTYSSYHIGISKKKVLLEKLNNNKITTIDVTEAPSEIGFLDYLKNLYDSFNDLSGCLINSHSIEKIQPLVSNFFLDKMLKSPEGVFNIPKVVFNIDRWNFSFVPSSFNLEEFIFKYIYSLNCTITQVAILCITIHLMHVTSRFLCSDKKLEIFNHLLNLVYFCRPDKEGRVENTNYSYHWFTTLHICTHDWISNYIYKNSYRVLHESILYKIYSNVKHLMIGFEIVPNFVKYQFLQFKNVMQVLFSFTLIVLAGPDLNIVYACLTIIYVVLGWLIDYLSYTWVLRDERFKLQYVLTLGFWLKHTLYGLLYILWLLMGIFTTNGIYFSILSNIMLVDRFNIIIFVLGTVTSLMGSNLWFFYGNPHIRQNLNISNAIRNQLIFPLLLRHNHNYNFSNLFRRALYWINSPIMFNNFTSFRRSNLEWFSFLGMVFSTYASWSWYTSSVFYSVSIVKNIIIWTVPTLVCGFNLIYMEDTRPWWGYYLYGFFYISFWTSICFASNSVLVGYINTHNALSVLIYLLPVNFILSFIYPLPLYRYDLNSHNINRLLHLLCFVILTFTTLLSGGTLWLIIAPA